MAAISKIRKHYVLLIIVIGVALLAFIIGDFGASRSNKVVPVGEIKGKKISIMEFEKRVNEVIELNSKSMTPEQLAEQNMVIRNSVWDEMVNEAIQEDEFKKLDITVTIDELDYLIRGAEPHPYIVNNFSNPQTGKIDRERLNLFLENLNNPEMVDPETRNTYLFIENSIKKETLEKKYSDMISAGYYYPVAFAKKDYEDKKNQYQVSFVAENYKSVPDTAVKASDSEYRAYYNKHKEEFKTKETRDIIYIEKNIVPSQEDRDNMVKRIHNSFTEFQKAKNLNAFITSESEVPYNPMWRKQGDLLPQYAELIMNSDTGTYISPFEHDGQITYYKVEDIEFRPDSLQATHILISYAGSMVNNPAITRTKEQAKVMADSILNIVRKDTAQITSIAMNLSDDASAKENKGRLGWFLDGMMIKPFNDYLIDNKIGNIGVVETDFGYHIVKVDNKTKAIKKVKLAEVTRTFVPSEETYRTEYMNLSSFASGINTVEEFENAAKEKGYNVKTQNNVGKMAAKLGVVKGSREIVKWAFSKDADKSPVSKIYEFEGKLVFAAVKNKQDEGYISLENVKQRIAPMVLRDKKAEIVAKKLEDAKANTSTLDGIASVLGRQIETAVVHGNTTALGKYGQEPAVVGAMLVAPDNSISEVIKGEQAAYVFVRTLGSTLPEKTDFVQDQRRIEQQTMSKVNTKYAIKQLVEEAGVKDNRNRYF